MAGLATSGPVNQSLNWSVYGPHCRRAFKLWPSHDTETPPERPQELLLCSTQDPDPALDPQSLDSACKVCNPSSWMPAMGGETRIQSRKPQAAKLLCSWAIFSYGSQFELIIQGLALPSLLFLEGCRRCFGSSVSRPLGRRQTKRSLSRRGKVRDKKCGNWKTWRVLQLRT